MVDHASESLTALRTLQKMCSMHGQEEDDGAIRAGFAQFAAFGQDVVDTKVYLAKGKLTTPVLAIGGEAAFGITMATVMRFTATDVQEAIVQDSSHSIMEENPSATIKLVTDFLKSNL